MSFFSCSFVAVRAIFMADEIAVDLFLDLLRESDLASGAQLIALIEEFCGEGRRPQSAQKLADELVKREVLTAWQAEMLLQGKHRGFRLGPYRILKPLGQGGMSKVFLAEHELMHRRSAIKVLPSKYQEDTDLLNRFHLEAQAIAALDHPNIVRSYDFNKDVRYGKEVYYLVMEYVEGPDLRRMVEEQGPLDYRKAADFISQAAEGLAYAHAAGFVHRDIKPANLLVDPHGVLKVLDLGLTMFTFETEKSLNPPEGQPAVVGTADYVAPEQVTDSGNVDGRADIYSLGHTFYFLLTGRRPFSKPTIMELLMAHRAEKPEPIGAFRPDVPLDLEAIIDKMTAKSPYQRYQTAKEVNEKLRKWLAESGSARSYSRISALMAEATRAKQSADGETARAKSEPPEHTELELAFLDDEPRPSPGAAEAKMVGNDQTDTAKLPAADANLKDRPPAAKDSSILGATKHPANQAKSKLPRAKPMSDSEQPANTHDKTTPPSVQTDLLAGLLAEDLMSTLPPAGLSPALGADAEPLPYTARSRSWKHRYLANILKSPWPWVGLAVVVFLASLLFRLIPFGSPSTEKPVDHPGRTVVTPSPDARQAPPPPLKGVSPPSSPNPIKPSVTPPPISPPTPLPPGVQEPSAAKASSPSKPVEAASKITTGEAASPPAATVPMPGQDEAKPSESPKPPTEEAIDELFAGLKTISIPPIKSLDPDPTSKANLAVQSQAAMAAWPAFRPPASKDASASAVMEIELTKSTNPDSPGVVMSAQLKCPGPDGKVVTLWQKSEQIFFGDPEKVNREEGLKILKNKGPKFFERFFSDVKTARAKARAKDPSKQSP